MTFGVNLIPKNSNNTQQTLGNSENKWDIYAEDLIVDNINGKTPITGVKGAANETYKTGEVNLTPADLGIPSANATQSTNGFMSSSDKIKLDGIEEGAQVNSITGVKGNTETNYRTGNINLTPENIGAKIKQTAVNDPTANGTAVEFIDSISQDVEGVITPTKKIVATVTTSTDGLMSATDKTKLDGIEANAQVNSITGVKGAAENSYRTGNINLTPENLGIPSSNATQSTDGFMSSTDKSKLDGIEVGAEVNTITGIKGNEESTYRTGNINLTSANIGSKAVQTAVTDPVAEGTSIEFIDSIEQDAQGVITPTKKTIPIANNLTETTAGKVLDATQGKILKNTIDNLDAEDVGAIKDDYSYDAASYPYTGQELILLHNATTGENTVTDVASFLSSAGGGSGTNQGALVHYTKTISVSAGSTAQTFPNSGTDDNITENMVVLQAVISNPAAQGSDWTFTTANGTVTLNGTVNAATNVTLYFGVSLSAAPSIQVNLGSTSADNILKTNPTPGVMGTLGRGNGGTGVNATDAADLRSKLGITPANIGAVSTSTIIDVYHGGTSGNGSVYKGILTASDNLNNLLESGYWEALIGDLPVNRPTDAPDMNIFVLNFNLPETEELYQIYVTFSGNNIYRWERKCYDGSWSAWLRVWNSCEAIPVANIAGAVNKAGDTMTGQLTFSNSSSLNGGVVIWADNEGGNIEIISPNGKFYQIDANNNSKLRIFTTNSNGEMNECSFNSETGAISAFGGFNGNATNVSGVVAIDHGGTNAVNAPDARSNLDIYSKSEVDTLLRWKPPASYVSMYGIATSPDGSVIVVKESGGTIFTAPPLATKMRIHTLNNIYCQFGTCDPDASLPTIITTGAKRRTFTSVDYAGYHVFDINGILDEYIFVGGGQGLNFASVEFYVP